MKSNLKKVFDRGYLMLGAFFSFLTSASWALADGTVVPAGAAPATSAAGAPQAPLAPSMSANLIPLVLMVVIIYFLMIRPQQKKVKEQQSMLSALKHGDEVLTSSGILGKVTGITEKVVTLEVADNVKVKMLKSQVSQVIKGQQVKDLA